MCWAVTKPVTPDVIFARKIASVQRPQAAYPGRLGASLSAQPSGGCPGLESRDFAQARHLLAAESALALGLDSAAAGSPRVPGILHHKTGPGPPGVVAARKGECPMKTTLFVVLMFITGSARDVKMLKKSLQAWTVGPQACVQFVDHPEPGAYTLKFRWANHYTVFVHSGTEADMDLYDSKGTLIWSEHKTAKAAGAYHEGHPEKEMYPQLWKALGCGQVSTDQKASR